MLNELISARAGVLRVARHGEPTMLLVNAAQMHHDGFKFYRSTNGVWLTERA